MPPDNVLRHADRFHVIWNLDGVLRERAVELRQLMATITALNGHVSRAQAFALRRATSFATPPRSTALVCAALGCAPGDLMPGITTSGDRTEPWAGPVPLTSAAHLDQDLLRAMRAVEPRFGADRRFDQEPVQKVAERLYDRRRGRR
jgi:DNA-binding Xre family transcriptional regulator